MSLSRPLLVRMVLYSILLVMALVIRHRLQNRPPHAPAPTSFEITIEDGATIDFSKGRPEVRATSEDQGALEAAAKEMTEAAKDTTFPSRD